MIKATEALERLAALVVAFERVCADYESESEGARLCGYLSHNDKRAYMLARETLIRARAIPETPDDKAWRESH